MTRKIITEDHLRNTLRAFRSGRDLSDDLLDLHILDSAGKERFARAARLQEYLQTSVISAVNRQRRLEGLPLLHFSKVHSRRELLSALQQDFALRNAALEVWSALLYQFFLPVRFSQSALAEAALVSERQFRRRLANGVQRLAALLRVDEAAAWRVYHRQQLRSNLPLRDNASLFGVQQHIEMLHAWLQDPKEPPIISIEGQGGIGKTALALAVAETFLDQEALAGIPWVSARQNWLDLGGSLHDIPHSVRTLQDVLTRLALQLGLDEVSGMSMEDKKQAIKTVLRTLPHLVVVDNLESVHDISALLPVLAEIAGRSRILLTTRQSVRTYPFVRCFKVPPLEPQAAFSLWQDTLERRSRPSHDRNAFEQVYALVGGLPLALKLVASQLAYLSLEVVTTHLQSGRTPSPAHLYTYIYRHTWMMLDDPARQLLLSMLWISPQGEDAAWLRHMSSLPEDEFSQALQQLMEFSLLDVSGGLNQPRYHLHRLTDTFLRTEILQEWDEDT